MISLSRTAKLTPMCSYLNDAVTLIENETNFTSRTLEIPVLYGTEYGPDLERISIHSGMSIPEVIKRHSDVIYTVSFIGFLLVFHIVVVWMIQFQLPGLKHHEN